MLEKINKNAMVLGAVLVLVLVGGIFGALSYFTPAEEPVERTYQCDVYTEQGCAKFVVADGGEIEVQSGGTLDIQSGATSGWGGAIDLDSTLNVDGAVTLNSTLDVDGNISSGTGSITITDSVNITGAVDLDSTLQFGTSDLYPVGFATSGQQLVYGTEDITGTTTAAHGLTTVTWALADICEAPGTGAGDSAFCIATVSANVVTVTCYQDDWTTEATEVDTCIMWQVVGAP